MPLGTVIWMSCSSTCVGGKVLQSLVGFVPTGIVPVQESEADCPAADGTVTLPEGGVDAPVDPVMIRRTAAIKAAVSTPASLRMCCLPGSPRRMGDAESGETIPSFSQNATSRYFVLFTTRKLINQSK